MKGKIELNTERIEKLFADHFANQRELHRQELVKYKKIMLETWVVVAIAIVLGVVIMK